MGSLVDKPALKRLYDGGSWSSKAQGNGMKRETVSELHGGEAAKGS